MKTKVCIIGGGPSGLLLSQLLDLKGIDHREVSCYGISAKEETNLEAVLSWLVKRANELQR